MFEIGVVFRSVGTVFDVCGGAGVYVAVVSDVAAGVYGSYDFAVYSGDGG